MRSLPPVPTRSQVNKAGSRIRRFFVAPPDSTPPTREALERAIDVLVGYRAAHSYPLSKANMGLRSMVASEGCEIEVTQRLKQTRTIIDKLLRYPNMHLATMQDIGGCRAVLNSIGEIRRVERRLARNRPPVGYRDYVAEPKLSGYRGVHVVVEYDGRMIEVQLRTRVMHEWAFTVERLGGRIGADLKSSRGPKEVLDLLGVISEAMAIEESGGTVEPILLERVRALRAVAEPFLRGGAG